MNLRLRRLITWFGFSVVFVVAIQIIFWIIWVLKRDFWPFEIAIVVSGLTIFFPLLFFLILIIMKWKEQKNTPPSEIDIDFVNNIIDAQQNLLISFNKNYEIIWTNNSIWLKKVLNLTRVSSIYGKKLESFVNAENTKAFQNNEMKNVLLRFSESQNFIASNVGNYLMLLKTKQLVWELKQFIRNEQPVFLVLEIDENASSSIEETKLEKYQKTIGALLSLEIHDFFHNQKAIAFELTENEYAILMPFETMNILIENEFSFIKDLSEKIRKKHKIDITFSGGMLLPERKTPSLDSNEDIQPFSIDNFFNKSLQAKKIAQTRGGDQVVVMKFDDSFVIYGQQQKTMKLLPNAKKKYIELLRALANYESIIITGHRLPDFDTIGSGVGLKVWIEKRFPKIKTEFVTNSISKNMEKEVGQFLEKNKLKKHITKNFDFIKWTKNKEKKLIIFVDTNSPNYTDFPVAEIEKIDQAIFDHHIPQFKLKQVIFEYSNLQYSSAAEIVLNIWMHEKNIKRVPRFVLIILLGGILLDTDNLQRNMNSNTLAAIDFINKYVLIQPFIDKFKKMKINIQQEQNPGLTKMKTLQTFPDGVLLMQHDPKASQINTAITVEQYLNNHPIKTAILVMSKDENSNIFISVRSHQDGINAASICEPLGGGGDAERAAAQIEIAKKKYTWKKVIEEITKNLQKITKF